MSIRFLALAALALADATPEAPGRKTARAETWDEVPVFVVEELRLEEGDWWSRSGIRRSGDELRVEAEARPDGTLEILVSDFNGLSGTDVRFRLAVSDGGVVSVSVRSRWHSDIVFRPPDAADPVPFEEPLVLDPHGDVLIEARDAGSDAPLELRFELHGIRVGWPTLHDPVRIEGELAVDLSELRSVPALAGPAWQAPVDDVDASDLREVSREWPDGTPRSRGRVDPTGRRQGLWTTSYANGSKHTESAFRHGERHGEWRVHDPDGELAEEGRFERGVRAGRWTEHLRRGGERTTLSGLYASDRKEGEWVERRSDGSVVRRGPFVDGSERGDWTTFWPNGNEQSRGRMVGGYRTGEWTWWREDGTYWKSETAKGPLWARH